MSPIGIFKNKRNTEQFKSSLKLFVPNKKSKVAFTLAEVFSIHFKNNRKYAFTLAEVLITLGIIGIVAALTLPTLLANYQKNVIKTQFKKAVSVIEQAYVTVEHNLGNKPECFYWDKNPYGSAVCVERYENGACKKYKLPDGSDLPSDYNGLFGECPLVTEEMKKVLNVVKVCANNSYANGCIPKYKGIDTILKEKNPNISDYDIISKTQGISSWRENNILTKSETWVLADGTIIILGGNSIQVFAIDVNGQKGPNKWGWDIFRFLTASNFNKPLHLKGYGSSAFVDSGGVTTGVMLQNK